MFHIFTGYTFVRHFPVLMQFPPSEISLSVIFLSCKFSALTRGCYLHVKLVNVAHVKWAQITKRAYFTKPFHFKCVMFLY